MFIEYIALKVRDQKQLQAFVELIKKVVAHAFKLSNKLNSLRDNEFIKKN
jgi:hypothetical protein